MAQHACISIGIDRYQFFQPLNFASADARAMENFFVDEAGWTPAKCLLMTDNSTAINGISTYPNRQNIEKCLNSWCWETLQPGDFLWFFFSGYGININGAEYLMPLDGDPQTVKQTGISLAKLYRQFRAPGIDVMVFLDVNRSQGGGSGQGFGEVAAQLSHEFNIPTFLSCQSSEFSHEAMSLKHGIFTAALLEALRFNPDLSIETLRTYLTSRVPELSEHHWRPVQHPLVLVPNDGTIFRPIFSATSQEAIGNWVPNPPINRPEPVRRTAKTVAKSQDSVPKTSALVAYQEPARSAPPPQRPKAKTKSGAKIFNSLVIGIAGVAVAIGSLLAISQPSKKAPLITAVSSTDLGGVTPLPVTATDSYQRGKQSIKAGDARSYAQAIALEQQVPSDHPHYSQAQRLIADLSKEIYLVAQSHAQSKNWQQAIEAARLVPKDSNLYSAAQNSIQLWQNKRQS
jgi:hypothetical protein